MRPETLDDLADSLSRERAFKGFVVICLVVALAALGTSAHAYLPIVLFALLADLMALNRLRRLVATLHQTSGQQASASEDHDDDLNSND